MQPFVLRKCYGHVNAQDYSIEVSEAADRKVSCFDLRYAFEGKGVHQYGYYVDKSRLSRSFELWDSLILPELLNRIAEYERKLILFG